jgi:hypothetical protein
MGFNSGLTKLLIIGGLIFSGCKSDKPEWVDGYLTSDAIQKSILQGTGYLFNVEVETKEGTYIFNNSNDISEYEFINYDLALKKGKHIKFNKNKFNDGKFNNSIGSLNFDKDLIILPK